MKDYVIVYENNTITKNNREVIYITAPNPQGAVNDFKKGHPGNRYIIDCVAEVKGGWCQ